ncbi:uncharacterized protein [Nicotiana sylvestris]|uniref:uncharacterized protein n=1 Tax=Nicotiana sylvestris TaxID=4096 RepID=UPI00388CABCC
MAELKAQWATRTGERCQYLNQLKRDHEKIVANLKRKVVALEGKAVRQARDFETESGHCYNLLAQMEAEVQQLQDQHLQDSRALKTCSDQIRRLLIEKKQTKDRIRAIAHAIFDLYEGHGDPVAHLRGFCSKMRGAGEKDELLIAYFGQSLSGSALEWYTRQDPGRWYTWDDLAQAFIGHFQYNLEIVPDHLSLLKLEKKPGESFREFGFRWREQVARVDPPMRESEMVDYFLQTLEPTYFGHLVTSVGKSFNEVVKMGAMIEEGLKSNKILSYSALKATTQAIQSGTGGVLGKKKKEEVAAVEANVWSRLKQLGMLTPVESKAPNPPPRNLDHFVSCEYCSRMSGHDIEKCWKLKNAIQELIDNRRIEVVMMIRSTETKEKTLSAGPGVQLKAIKDKPVLVMGKGPFVYEKKQEPVKIVVSGSISAPVVVVKGAYVEPVVIKPVVQLPVVDSKAVPWKYDKVAVTYKGKEIEEESCKAQGLTRSGGCFAPEELRKAKGAKDNPVPVKKAILNEAHVPDKISVNHLETIANKIFEVNRVAFSDDELPMEGTEHNKALYLTVKCEGSMVTRALIDNGSSANICTLSTLNS